MKFSSACTDLIAESEGCILHPYVDPASGGEPITIGIGSTHYCDGTKVTMSDANITKEKAEEMLSCHLDSAVLPCIQQNVTIGINQQQLDALGSFVYNLGCGNFKSSTLLRKINLDPSDSTIEAEFMKWNKANHQVMSGLTKRREKESALYFS